MTANAIGSNAAPHFPNNPSYFLGSLPTYTGTATIPLRRRHPYNKLNRLWPHPRSCENRAQMTTGISTTEFAFIRNNANASL
jgi:hypothetical protein